MFKQRLASLWNDKVDTLPAAPAAGVKEKFGPNALAEPEVRKKEESPVVEREREIGRLTAAWDAAREGRGRVMLIAGEAGIGKSTLAEMLVEHVRAGKSGFKIARAVCSSQSGRDEPFWPFADAMSQLVAAPARKLTSEVIDAFLDIAPSWTSIIPIAGPVVDASLKTAQVVRARARSSDAPNPERLLREYTGALKKVTDKAPALIFIDDLHWSDNGTIKLLSHLARVVSDLRVLIIGAYRPSDLAVEDHPLRALIAEILRYDRDAQIELDVLSRDGVRTLIGKLYPGNKFTERLPDELTERTGGAPLFVVESLRLMQEREEIKKDPADARWMLARSLNEADLPPSVEAIIQKRVQRLPAVLQELLALAAVQGGEFDAAVLAYVTGRDEIELMAALEPAEKDHNVISYAGEVDLGDDVTVRYRFTNNLFQRELLNSLRGKRRLIAFRKTAQGLDNLWPDDSEDLAAKLASLYQNGKVHDSAARFMIIAGHYARAAGSVTRAIELYEGAERSLDHARAQDADDDVLVSQQRQQIDEALSYLYEVDASYAKCAARTRRALQAGMLVLGWRRYASLRMREAALAVRRGEISAALEILQALYATLGDASADEAHSYEAFQLPAELSKVLTLTSQVEAGAQFASDALRELDQLPHVDWYKAARARLNTSLAMARHAQGDYGRAIALSEETLVTLRDLNMVGTFATLLSNLTQLYVEMGMFDKVPDAVRSMIETSADTSNESLLASAHLANGLALLLQGNTPQALEALEEADRWAGHIGTFEDRPKILVLQVFALLDLDRVADARRVLDEAVPLAKASGLREWDAYSSLARARTNLAMGDAERAIGLAREACEVMRDEGTLFDEAIAQRILARAHVALNQNTEATRAFGRAQELLRSIGNTTLAEQTEAMALAMGIRL